MEPEGFNGVRTNVWEEIIMYVDSGATEIVITEEMLSAFELLDGPKKQTRSNI